MKSEMQIVLESSIQRDGDALMVDARLLHGWLEIDTRFNDWAVRRLADALAVEGEDFYSTLSKTSGRPSNEYSLTLDLAKELAMLERSERGRQIRRYFIDAEKELRRVTAVPALPQSLPEALRLAADLAEQKEQLAAENAILAPKAEQFQALMEAKGTYSVAEAAKLLHTGENRLFKLLRERQIFQDGHRSGGDHHNVPYQRYLDAGYFELRTRPRPDGKQVTYTPRVTPKGLAWLERGMREQMLLPPVQALGQGAQA